MSCPSLHEMLQQLIAAPSVSSFDPHLDQSNLAVIERLAEWCEALGFRSEILAVPGYAGKYNLVAALGSGPDGLVLSGHTDTVPFDADCWTSDPFSLNERDGRLYGLGTSDMKGFFALALEAARKLDGKPPQRPLLLVATADEESTMCGAKSLLAAQQALGRHAVIGEPTGLKPIRMHKGIGMDAIRISGHSGHSSDPSLGRNAIEGMHTAIAEILAWRAELQARHHNPAFKVAVPTLNLGHVHGGDNPNRICAECELHFDLRPLPGMSLELLREELDRRLGQRLADSGLSWQRVELFEGIPPLETPASAEIVHAAEEITGHQAEAVAFGTEGPYLNELGMQTIVFGPGDIDQAHQPDEFLALERIPRYVGMLERLIQRFCLA